MDYSLFSSYTGALGGAMLYIILGVVMVMVAVGVVIVTLLVYLCYRMGRRERQRLAIVVLATISVTTD